jgi:quercetin dioxygenase-like cupin family protein
MESNKQSTSFVESNRIEWEVAGEGVRRKILGYDQSLMMVMVEFRKGAAASLHRHMHRQVTLVERGSFEVQIGPEKKVLSRGDSFLVPPDVEHGVVALQDGCLVDVFTPMRAEFLSPKP